MYNKKSLRKIKYKLLFCMSVFLLVIPFIANIFYSLPVKDDFAILNGCSDASKAFPTAVLIANNTWKSLQGTWFFTFLEIILNPLLLLGYSNYCVGIELIVFFVFFISVVLIFVRFIITKMMLIENKEQYIGMVSVIVLTMILNTDIYPEIYSWFVGSTIYLLSLALSLICIMILICYSNNIKMLYATGLAGLGLLTCMSFTAAAMICSVYFCLIINKIIKNNNKKRLIQFSIPFMFCLLGAFICVLAPGNYRRHYHIDSTGLHIGTAIKDAFFVEVMYGYSLIRNPVVFVGLIIIGFIFYYLARKYHGQQHFVYPLKLLLVFALSMFAVIVPVTLGYSSADMPNRVAFVINTYMVLEYSIFAANFGVWLGDKFTDVIDDRVMRLAVFVLILSVCFGPLNRDFIGTTPYVQQIKSHSEIITCHNEWISVYNEIMNSHDMNVIIKRQSISGNNIIETPDFGDNKDSWNNRGVAFYFGKKSVRLIVNKK